MAVVRCALVVVEVMETDDRLAALAIHENLLHMVEIEPLNDTKPKRRKTKRK
jgi:hypothetical protein